MLPRAVSTSLYSGSPSAPGSLVRSSTAIDLTVLGKALRTLGGGERAIQADLEQADLLALVDQVIDVFMSGFSAGAHDDDDAFGVGGPQ